jgi:hypothetical protein
MNIALQKTMLCMLAAMAAHETALQGAEIAIAGQWSDLYLGPVSAVSIYGNYAYLAAYTGLQVLDITNPSNPARIGSTKLSLSAMTLSGNHAYGAGSGGFYVIDLSNPTQPVRVGGVTNIGPSGGVAVRGNYAYVAAGGGAYPGAFHVIDTSDPANPVRVGGASIVDARSVAVSGNYAYVGAGFALQVVDVTNPTNPVPVGSVNFTNIPYGVTVSGSYAYVAAGSLGLQIIDISNPANPVRVAGVRATNTSAEGVVLSGNHAYLADDQGLQVIDISNPTTPIILSRYQAHFPFVFVHGLALSGSSAYLAGGEGIQVIDISNPANLTLAGRFLTTGSSAVSVAIANNHAYLADRYAGLQVIDISNPVIPVRVGGYYDLKKGGCPFDIAVSGSHAYMLDYSNGLQVFDISSPVSPALMGTCALTNHAERVTVSGGYAYIAHDTNVPGTPIHTIGMSVIDVSNPTSPAHVADYFVRPNTIGNWGSGYANSVKVSGPHAYLAYGGEKDTQEFGFQSFGAIDLVDVSNPAHPVSVGQYPSLYSGSYDFLDVALSGAYAYALYYTREWGYYDICPGGVLCRTTYPQTGGLLVLDVSTPTNPVFKGAFSTAQQHSSLAVSGKYAYLLGGSPHLRVLDISNPTNLVLVATSDTPVQRIAVSGNYAYVAAGAQGLQILCLDCPRLSATLLGGQLQVTWPTATTNFVLESAANLPAAQWLPVSGAPQIQGTSYILTVPATGSAAFFRLRGQ